MAKLEFVLTLVNLGLLLALFLIFLKMWRQTRSTFSAGLTLFAGVFLLKQVVAILIALEPRNFPVANAQLQLLANLGEAVALGILLYIVAR